MGPKTPVGTYINGTKDFHQWDGDLHQWDRNNIKSALSLPLATVRCRVLRRVAM